MAAPAGARGDGEAGHLPKQGGQQTPGPPPELPRQLRGTTPQMRGRYPHFDVLATTEHWDAHTREVVLGRVASVPPWCLRRGRHGVSATAASGVATWKLKLSSR